MVCVMVGATFNIKKADIAFVETNIVFIYIKTTFLWNMVDMSATNEKTR